MFSSFFWSGRRGEWTYGAWKHVFRAYSGLLILIIILLIQVNVIAVTFNEWNETFFDTVDNIKVRGEKELWDSVMLFGKIAAAEIVFFAALNYLNRVYTLWWRQAITENYVPRWSKTTSTVEGSSQRIQQDPKDFAVIVVGLGLDFTRSVLTLIAFVPILWPLSNHFVTGPLAWEGSLVVIAFCCSLGGMAVSWIVSSRLPRLEYNNEQTEAALRKQLVFAEDKRSFLSAGNGWQPLFADVVKNHHRLFLHYGYFDGWQLWYTKCMMLLPYLVCVPHLASGTVTLAILMKLVHAFGEVQGGFSIILKDWTKVTKLRCAYRRLVEFEQALVDAPVLDLVQGATADVIPLLFPRVGSEDSRSKMQKGLLDS